MKLEAYISGAHVMGFYEFRPRLVLFKRGHSTIFIPPFKVSKEYSCFLLLACKKDIVTLLCKKGIPILKLENARHFLKPLYCHACVFIHLVKFTFFIGTGLLAVQIFVKYETEALACKLKG